MVDLSTTYGGVKIKNPLIIGGGPTSGTPEICGKAAKAGWAGLVLKTNTADDVVERFPNTFAPWPLLNYIRVFRVIRVNMPLLLLTSVTLSFI